MKVSVSCWSLIIALVLATIIVSANPGNSIRVLKNEEVVLGDRGDYIRIYDYDHNQNKLIKKTSFRRDYEGNDNIAVGDVNGDGISEIIVGDASSDKIYVYDKSGRLFTSRNVGYETEDDLACGDVDGDGKDEIVVGDNNRDRALIIQVNNDWSTWTASIYLPHGFWGGDRIAVGDVNGDGKDEIVAADTDDNKFHIYQYTGGGGGNNGRKIKQIDVKFKINDKDTVQYDHEDEIACGDVNGDGIDEIIYGNGYDTHKIYIYNFDGSILFEFNAYFDNADELSAGDVNMDGLDEIITGDSKDDRIHVYGFDAENGVFQELYSINVDYENADGLAVGDIYGDSMVVEEVRCQRTTIPNQLILVVNAPPKQIGINYNNSDPYYTDFSVKYENEQSQSTSHSVKTVNDVGFSLGFEQKFNILAFKSKIKAQLDKNWKWKVYKSKLREIKIADGLETKNKDVAILMTTIVDICEFKILKPDNMAVINGEQQYMYITKPISVETRQEELDTPDDYVQYGIPQIHTVGYILTYPDKKEDLVNYQSQNEIFSKTWEVGETSWWKYYSELVTSEEKREFSTSLKISTEFSAESELYGTKFNLKGHYGKQRITTAELKTTEQTDFKINYKGANFDDSNKKYHVGLVLYKDSEDGHLILDWYVTDVGKYYEKPDLLIQDIKIKQRPYCITCGCKVSALVKNYGLRSPTMTTYLYVDGQLIESKSTPSLNKGESAWINFSYQITGEHTIKICADGPNSIEEISENNNFMEKRVICKINTPTTKYPKPIPRYIPKIR